MSTRFRVTCIAQKCSDQHPTLSTWPAAEAYMDEHAREVEHDGRWAITFRIEYPGGNPLPGVAYRQPVRVTDRRLA